MTALAGLWRFDGRPDAAAGCARMLAAQRPYGPHHGAHWSKSDVALGRQLMRVLPEDDFDRQPLIGGGGRYVLVADVRLDNRDELIEILRIPVSQARTLCDAAGLSQPLQASDVAFGVGPRINAAGRMEDARLALQLCLSDSAEEARVLVSERKLPVVSILGATPTVKIEEAFGPGTPVLRFMPTNA